MGGGGLNPWRAVPLPQRVCEASLLFANLDFPRGRRTPGRLSRKRRPSLPAKGEKAEGPDVILGAGGNGEIKASVDQSLACG